MDKSYVLDGALNKKSFDELEETIESTIDASDSGVVFDSCSGTGCGNGCTGSCNHCSGPTQ